MDLRKSRKLAGSPRNRRINSGVRRLFPSGMHQFGVRWKTCSCAAVSATIGMICTPVAPVPMTPTRLPLKSTPAGPPFSSRGHRDEWKDSPRNVSTPGMLGTRVAESGPTAEIRNVQVTCVPSSSPSLQALVASS